MLQANFVTNKMYNTTKHNVMGIVNDDIFFAPYHFTSNINFTQ